MKLPRLRRKLAPETAEPASVGPAAPVLQVVIYSNTDLPEQEFTAQTEKLRRVTSYDNATRSWYGQIPFDRPEWAAEILTALFDVARLHGTDIRVQTRRRARTAHPGRSYAQQERVPADAEARPVLFEHGYKRLLGRRRRPRVRGQPAPPSRPPPILHEARDALASRPDGPADPVT